MVVDTLTCRSCAPSTQFVVSFNIYTSAKAHTVKAPVRSMSLYALEGREKLIWFLRSPYKSALSQRCCCSSFQPILWFLGIFQELYLSWLYCESGEMSPSCILFSVLFLFYFSIFSILQRIQSGQDKIHLTVHRNYTLIDFRLLRIWWI